MEHTRKEMYERKRSELMERCLKCVKTEHPSTERCEYGCIVGRRIRMLEAEYSDITGWSHRKW